MLKRIDELLLSNEDFAFETTLATRSFHQLIDKAKKIGYTVTLIYFWLESVELAELLVQTRVEEGGHNVPKDVMTSGIIEVLKICLTCITAYVMLSIFMIIQSAFRKRSRSCLFVLLRMLK
jgi:predicted ABC-type ATPase